MDDGLAAYQQRNYCEAAAIWKVLSEQGDAEAQYNLGVLYKEGIGVPQDHAEALNWLRKSSDQGHNNAGLILGMLEEGESENGFQDETMGKPDNSGMN